MVKTDEIFFFCFRNSCVCLYMYVLLWKPGNLWYCSVLFIVLRWDLSLSWNPPNRLRGPGSEPQDYRSLTPQYQEYKHDTTAGLSLGGFW